MGGNALKNCVTRRYTAEEYKNLECVVWGKLHRAFPGVRHEDISAYIFKESFGDMDIVIEAEGLPTNWVDKIQEAFNPKEMFKNGNVLSFEFREFQIDLIVTPRAQYQTSLDYFAYNDLGNLLGRIAHSMGLKLGHEGLSYNWRVDTYQFKNVILLTNWEDILPVFELSYKRWENGFDTLEDIFKFVVSSPFFNKDIYLLENRNHTSRVRDAKRKTYTLFLDWIKDYEETKDQIFNRGFKDYPEGKKAWLPYLFEHIESFERIYHDVQAEWDVAVLFKQRYNGDLVSTITGLKTQELGKFMVYMKEVQFGVRFTDIVLKGSDAQIKAEIERCYSWFRSILPNPLE